jgi:hypothetical protein
VIPNLSVTLFVYPHITLAIMCLGATSFVQGRTALAHKSVVLPTGFWQGVRAATAKSKSIRASHGTKSPPCELRWDTTSEFFQYLRN